MKNSEDIVRVFEGEPDDTYRKRVVDALEGEPDDGYRRQIIEALDGSAGSSRRDEITDVLEGRGTQRDAEFRDRVTATLEGDPVLGWAATDGLEQAKRELAEAIARDRSPGAYATAEKEVAQIAGNLAAEYTKAGFIDEAGRTSRVTASLRNIAATRVAAGTSAARPVGEPTAITENRRSAR